MFLNCQLQDKTVLDENLWKLVSIDYGIQTDGQSCGVFVLKVRYVHNILNVYTL